MNEVKCIYCNKGKSDGIIINESDIIPESLTNAKLKCSNVCSIDHNNKFSDYFESEVINDLAFLRNKLNIRNKGRKFPSYPSKLKIGDNVYIKKNLISDSNPIGNGSLISEDGTTLFSPISDSSDKKVIESYDLKTITIEKTTTINLEIFSKDSMFRMVAKIAYEWFCKVNDIMYMNPSFSNIIDFITTGTSSKPVVTPISDLSVIYPIDSLTSKGSHFLAYYITDTGEIKSIVSIFGVALYEVIISYKIENLNNLYKLASQEFDLIKTHEPIKYKNINDLSEEYNNNFIHISSGEINIPYCVSDMDRTLSNKILLTDRVCRYLHNISPVFDKKYFKYNLIMKLNEILSFLFLNKPEFKRFSKEYGGDNFNNVNWQNSDKEFWLRFYITYLIGKSDYDNINDEIFNNLLHNNLNITSEGNIDLSIESHDKWKAIITEDNNFKEIILKGFQKINNWL